MVVKYTGIGADRWSKFDEGTTHIGYKARTGSKIVWAAADKGASFTCIAFVRADPDESEAELHQFYQSADCK